MAELSYREAVAAGIAQEMERDQRVVCVVEDPNNIVGIEVTRQFNGLYHVLGGALSPLRGIGPEQLKIKSLVDRIAKGSVEFEVTGLSGYFGVLEVKGHPAVFAVVKKLQSDDPLAVDGLTSERSRKA